MSLPNSLLARVPLAILSCCPASHSPGRTAPLNPATSIRSTSTSQPPPDCVHTTSTQSSIMEQTKALNALEVSSPSSNPTCHTQTIPLIPPSITVNASNAIAAVPRPLQVRHLAASRRRPHRAGHLGAQHLHLHRAAADAAAAGPRLPPRGPAAPRPPRRLLPRRLRGLRVRRPPSTPAQRRPEAQAAAAEPALARRVGRPPRPRLRPPAARAAPRLGPRARDARHHGHLRRPRRRQARPGPAARPGHPRRAPAGPRAR